MIAHLRGILLEKHPNQAVVEAGGVGYDVTIPVSTFTSLPGTGNEVQLRIHTHVREDALALFGFASAEEKLLFEKLISVSGIGPKLAITALSGLAAGELIAAIRAGSVERLVRVPGIGKKTAERIILELREKLPDGTAGVAAATAQGGGPPLGALDQDVISALMNLGGTPASAEGAVKKARAAGAPDEFEPLFRRALEFLR